jgi:hypothetical protein
MTVSSRLAVSLIAAALLPGCVGFAYFGTEHMDGLDPTAVYEAGNKRPVTEETLLRRMGEPDERLILSETKETWVYDRGLRWNGVALLVIIPIPLILPVGRDSDTFHMENGIATSVDRIVLTEHISACGMFPHGRSCRSETTRQHGWIDRND